MKKLLRKAISLLLTLSLFSCGHAGPPVSRQDSQPKNSKSGETSSPSTTDTDASEKMDTSHSSKINSNDVSQTGSKSLCMPPETEADIRRSTHLADDALAISPNQNKYTRKLLAHTPILLPGCGHITLDYFGHKRPKTGGPTKATAYFQIKRGPLLERLSLSIHGIEGKSEAEDGLTASDRYDSITWHGCTLSLIDFKYNNSITVEVIPQYGTE